MYFEYKIKSVRESAENQIDKILIPRERSYINILEKPFQYYFITSQK